MEKMSMAKQAETRAMLYEKALNPLAVAGFKTETIKGGALIDLGEGQFAKLNISICDATKFDLEKTRAEYQEAVAKAAERAEAKAQKAREKAEKAAAKAAKEAEKSKD